jgi:hypothetical protein
MAIGTSVKVGFDGEAVKRGFGGIKGMFTGMSRSFGKGMAMMGGAVAGKTLLDLGYKLATGISALEEFSGGAEDAALQTGSTVSEIIKLNRALELAGANIDASRMLSTLSDNMYDATHGGEDLQNILASIGVNAFSLSKLSPMEQFKTIGAALNNFSGDMGELNNITQKLFGAKMGMQLIRLFKNNDAFLEMGKDVDQFAKNVEENASELGAYGDQLQRIPYLWKGVNLAIFKSMGGSGNYLKKLFDGMDDAINSGNFDKLGYLLKSEFAKAIEMIASSDFVVSIKNIFKDLGRNFGEGISESIRESLPSLGLPSFFGGKGKGKETAMLEEMRQTNLYLASIERTNGTYA